MEVGYLLICHAYEDINEALSKTSERLKNGNAMTLEKLFSRSRKTFDRHAKAADLSFTAS